MDTLKRKKKKKKSTPEHSAAEAYQETLENDCVGSPATGKRYVSADERRSLAAQGHALPDGSYPIAGTEDLANAARLASSGHGDAKAARKLIARRARELGVPNPLSAVKGTTGNPVDNVLSPTGSYADQRASTPITAGHAAYSTGYHMGNGRAGELAVGHPLADSPVPGAFGVQHLDLQTVNRSPLATIRAGRGQPGDMFRPQATAHLASMDQASAAGMPRGLGRNRPSNDLRRTPNAPDSGGDFTGTNDIPTEHHVNLPGRARDTASPESHGRYGVTRKPTRAMKTTADKTDQFFREHNVTTMDLR